MSPRATALVTWVSIAGMFMPWALAAYRTMLNRRRLSLGLFAAVWSAVICMVLTVSFGFGELLTSLSWLEQQDAASTDFVRSGWLDLSAFAIADVFDAGFRHLLIGPAVTAVLGGIAAVLASTRPQQEAGAVR
jgi:hypothetical protein